MENTNSPPPPPPPPPPLPQFSDNHLNNNDVTSDNDSSPETHLSQTPSEPIISDSQLDDTFDPPPHDQLTPQNDAVVPPPKKRRRRKKQFPGMIPSSAAVNHLRLLRAAKPTTDKSTEDAVEIDDAPSKNRRRRRRTSDVAKEVDIEALIAISVGFPIDSLTEEEIEANVVSQIGGSEQSNYIVVRNHILARWRSNVDVWMTKDHAFESIRVEHRGPSLEME